MKKRRLGDGVHFGNLFFMDGWCCLPEPGEDVEQEIRRNFEEIKAELSRHGTGLENVLKVTVYLKDINDRERSFNKVWNEYFPEEKPARTCIGCDLGKVRVELDLIVALPEE